MKNKIPLPGTTWSVKDINTFIHHLIIHKLMMHNTDYLEREIDHNYSSDNSNV